MAKVNNVYTARITDDVETRLVGVDIFNLPRDVFSADRPLEIVDDVELGRAKNPVWPDFTNVCVYGTLDCGNFAIGIDTVLPQKITKLVCKYAIPDLGVLFDKLPGTVQCVVIRTNLLNNIKKNVDGALDVAREFVKMYPGVTVTDEKQTLESVLRQIDMEKAEKQRVAAPVVKPIKKEEPKIKTAEWLSAEEVADECIIRSEKCAEIPRADLLRFIKSARSGKANLKLKSEMRVRADGVEIVCVHKDSIEDVLAYVVDAIEIQNQRVKKADKKTATPKTSDEKAVGQVAKKRYSIGAREVKPVKIKKYISKSAWGKIRAKVKDGVDKLIEILTDIENINVNPTDTYGNQVLFIKDGQVKVSPTIKFKNAKCLCQGFGTLDDRPRIVWGVCGNVFVCQDFFKEHENMAYNNLISDLDIDLSKIDLSDFLLVTDLIKDLAGGRDIPSGGDAGDVPPVKKRGRKPKVQTEVAPKAEETQSAVPAAVPSVDVAPESAAAEVAPKPKRQRFRKETIEWVEIYAVHYKYTELLKNVLTQQKELLQKMSRETDVDALVGMNDKLRELLERRKRYEGAIKKMKSVNDMLQEIKGSLDKEY